jgi:hypothetical protein
MNDAMITIRHWPIMTVNCRVVIFPSSSATGFAARCWQTSLAASRCASALGDRGLGVRELWIYR